MLRSPKGRLRPRKLWLRDRLAYPSPLLCQKVRGRLFDPVVWSFTDCKTLTGDGARHRRGLRGRREKAGASGREAGWTGRVRGQKLRLLFIEPEELDVGDWRLQ